MASTNLSYSGHTGVIKAKAYITEITTSGTSRQVRLRLAVYSADYSSGRDGYYSVDCSTTGTDTGSVSCVISGSELDIFDETFTVSLNSDNTTASIDLSFEAKLYSSSAGGYRTISGTITKLTLTEYIPKNTLSISAGTGSSITVTRLSSDYDSTGTLYNGSTIYSGDVLQITFSKSTGYDLSTHTVNGSTFTSGDSITVSGSISVISTASVRSYKLTIDEDAGTIITVERTSSPLQDASTGDLSDGDSIYYSDVLKITFSAETGYNLDAHTVDGSTFTSGKTKTVNAAVSVEATATVQSFKLSLSSGVGSTITVNRTKSPLQGASTGNLSNGETIYYADVLMLSFSATAGYEIKEQTVNGEDFYSGDTHTVTANVTIVTITNTLGLVFIDNGTTLEAYLIYIDNGESWEQYIPYVDNGTSWDMCS